MLFRYQSVPRKWRKFGYTASYLGHLNPLLYPLCSYVLVSILRVARAHPIDPRPTVVRVRYPQYHCGEAQTES